MYILEFLSTSHVLKQIKKVICFVHVCVRSACNTAQHVTGALLSICWMDELAFPNLIKATVSFILSGNDQDQKSNMVLNKLWQYGSDKPLFAQ